MVRSRMMSPPVARPPMWLKRSTRRTSAPLRAAATAADSPAEPPPTTSTSTRDITGTRDFGRSMNSGFGPAVTGGYGPGRSRLGGGAPLALALTGLAGGLSVQKCAFRHDVDCVHLAEGVGEELF